MLSTLLSFAVVSGQNVYGPEGCVLSTGQIIPVGKSVRLPGHLAFCQAAGELVFQSDRARSFGVGFHQARVGAGNYQQPPFGADHPHYTQQHHQQFGSTKQFGHYPLPSTHHQFGPGGVHHSVLQPVVGHRASVSSSPGYPPVSSSPGYPPVSSSPGYPPVSSAPGDSTPYHQQTAASSPTNGGAHMRIGKDLYNRVFGDSQDENEASSANGDTLGEEAPSSDEDSTSPTPEGQKLARSVGDDFNAMGDNIKNAADDTADDLTQFKKNNHVFDKIPMWAFILIIVLGVIFILVGLYCILKAGVRCICCCGKKKQQSLEAVPATTSETVETGKLQPRDQPLQIRC